MVSRETNSSSCPENEFPKNESKHPKGLLINIVNFGGYGEEFEPAIPRIHAGYHFIFHDPFELPSSSSKFYLVNSDKEIEVQIVPEINSIDDSIAHYDPVE